MGAVLIGAVAVPALLPWIPGRAFSFKGWLLGFIWTAGLLAVRGLPATASGWLTAVANLLIFPSLSAFIAMNFTGSSTYTSLTGAEMEVKRGLIPMGASLLTGVGLLVAGRFVGA